ncbi:POK8 protein, partial [Aphelocoma coerulescens]|nr:POK8 protein [Aphelocoma coerulescens]
MGTLQPGLPNPAVVPENWHLLIMDLKDWFFTIPLHANDMHLPLGEFAKAREAHNTFHQNARGLHRQFGITMEEAKGIVRACPTCSHHGPGLG